jgi:isopentenyl-diphosphate delta-isomerase
VNATRELTLVELVDPEGHPVGAATVQAAHTAPGQLHRAFSVLLFDPAGRTLLQRRADAKTRFPGRWANSCCGHPAPGRSAVEAATARLAEELGVVDVALVEVGVHTYRAGDPATGRVEHEYDHVLIGRVPPDLPMTPDPEEVSEVRWAAPDALLTEVKGPEYAPWLAGVLPIALR